MIEKAKNVAVIGGGPAGLAAAYTLAKNGVSVTVFEKDAQYLGGISRTVQYKGFRFDIGGHRFFSKSQTVESFWTEVLGDDFLERPRSSRIYYNKKYFTYPLKGMEALIKLGFFESVLCVLSYMKERLVLNKKIKSFEDWVTSQFGSRLFKIFFKTYTEKVWGMSCKDISADWAAQRIKGLSLFRAIKSAIFKQKKSEPRIKTLIDSFRYPRLGPGMMWEVCGQKVQRLGGKIAMGSGVEKLSFDFERSVWKLLIRTQMGVEEQEFTDVISSAPMSEMIANLSPTPSNACLKAAKSLKYRDFLTVALMFKDQNQFSDNWIYIHDPSVKVGRIQNYKSWSPEMVPDPSLNCYGLEYFCFEGDGLWESSDQELISLAADELEKIGLVKQNEVLDGYVVRQKKAYPVYDEHYKKHVQVIKSELQEHYPKLSLVGRNGMHKYNNQDHAVMTGMLAAESIFCPNRASDPWLVNEDAEYHEESVVDKTIAIRSVPESLTSI